MKFYESNSIRRLADSAAEGKGSNHYLGTLGLLEHVLMHHFDENGDANELGREGNPKWSKLITAKGAGINYEPKAT